MSTKIYMPPAISLEGSALDVGAALGTEFMLPVLQQVVSQIDPSDRLRLWAGLLGALTGAMQAHLGPEPAQGLLQQLHDNLVTIAGDCERQVH